VPILKKCDGLFALARILRLRQAGPDNYWLLNSDCAGKAIAKLSGQLTLASANGITHVSSTLLFQPDDRCEDRIDPCFRSLAASSASSISESARSMRGSARQQPGALPRRITIGKLRTSYNVDLSILRDPAGTLSLPLPPCPPSLSMKRTSWPWPCSADNRQLSLLNWRSV